MKMPDFWRLTTAQQDEVISYIGKECLQFWRYAARYGSTRTLEAMSVKIVPRPIRLLSTVIDQGAETDISPQTSFAAFAIRPEQFDGFMRNARVAEKKAEQGEDFKALLRELEPNESLQITDEDKRITRSELKDVIAEFVSVIGHHLKNSQPTTNKVTLRRWYDENSDVAEKIIGNHNGTFEQLTIQRLEVDEKYARKIIGEWNAQKAPLDSMRRYLVSTVLKSSGLAGIPTVLEVGFCARHDFGAEGRVQICKIARGQASGEAAHEERTSRARQEIDERTMWGIRRLQRRGSAKLGIHIG